MEFCAYLIVICLFISLLRWMSGTIDWAFGNKPKNNIPKVNNFFMTSDDALTALKSAKDKLDLELITQVEYDKLKDELGRFIT
jgi:hypothetical protein